MSVCLIVVDLQLYAAIVHRAVHIANPAFVEGVYLSRNSMFVQQRLVVVGPVQSIQNREFIRFYKTTETPRAGAADGDESRLHLK
eukprot:scaffold508306_cov17-Prasinocladus_malaysianus.AAC.1